MLSNIKRFKFVWWVEEEAEKFYGPGASPIDQKYSVGRITFKGCRAGTLSYIKAWDLVQRLNIGSEELWGYTKKRVGPIVSGLKLPHMQ